jgi:hypothetical protein
LAAKHWRNGSMSISDGGRVLSPGWRRRREWRRLMWLLAAPILVVIGAFALQPTYIMLDIPVARHTGGGDFWWETQRAELAYADAWGVLYLHRQVGTAYPEAHGWRTVEEAFGYFDGWLTTHGWTRSGPDVGSPEIPESRFLADANLRLYIRDRRLPEHVHLAIWPIGGSVDGFHVVLVTERPSWLRQLYKGLD